jgi:hypothetical protein
MVRILWQLKGKNELRMVLDPARPFQATRPSEWLLIACFADSSYENFFSRWKNLFRII